MVLTIPDDVLRNAGMNEDELRLELAVFLFDREKATLGQAGSIAGISQIEFQRELSKRRIAVHYDVDEFEQDIETLRDSGLL